MSDFSNYGGASSEWLEIQKSLPISTPNVSIEQLKATTNDGREVVAAEEFLAYASQIATNDHDIPTRDGSYVEARTYRSRSKDSTEILPIYLHFHGGGWLFGTRNSEDAICARIAANVDVVVLNVNYRHTPEFRYPTAWLDAEDAVKWASENGKLVSGDPERIFIGGISAGGNLCASLTLQQALGRGVKPRVKGQILMIPNLVNADCYELQLSKMKNQQVSSMEENKDAPILSWARIRQFTDLLKVENPDPQDKILSPGNASAEEIKGVPPTVIIVAGLDPIRDEGLLYGKLLAENG